MILHGERRDVEAPQTLERPVVQVPVGELDAPERRPHDVPIARPPVGLDREPVVVARDLDAAGPQVLHGLVRAAVPERQLGRPTAEREPQELVPEADAEHRHSPEQLAARVDPIRRRGGVARPVGQDHAVESAGAHLGGRRRRRDDGRLDPGRREPAEDVPLQAEVVGRHPIHVTELGARRSDEVPSGVGLVRAHASSRGRNPPSPDANGRVRAASPRRGRPSRRRIASRPARGGAA